MGILLLMASISMFIPTLISVNEWWIPLLTLVLAVVNAFFLARLAHRSGLTRMPSVVPAFIYQITLGANITLHTFWQGQLIVMALIVVIQLMQRTSHQEDATEESFLAVVLIVLASLLWSDMVLFVVVWIVLLAIEKKISFRTISAMLIALAMMAIYYVIGRQMDWFIPEWSAMAQRQWVVIDWSFVQVVEILLLIFSLYFVIASFLRINRDNISVQKYLQMISFVLLAVLFWYAFPVNERGVVATIPAVVSMAASVYFLTTQTLTRGIIFALYIVGTVYEFMHHLYLNT